MKHDDIIYVYPAMNLVVFNTEWMLFNLMLALIGVLFGFGMWKARALPLKIIFGFLWLLFIPNSIYILTDLIHLHNQWTFISNDIKGIILFQFTLLELAGLATFVASLYPFERMIRRSVFKRYTFQLIVLLNGIIAFGVVIGRIQRTNSWEVFTSTQKVIFDSLRTLTSIELMLLVACYALVGNIIYFSLRQIIVKKSSQKARVKLRYSPSSRRALAYAKSK